MSTQDNLDILEKLDRRGARLRRKATLAAWGSVLGAAAVMVFLIYLAQGELSGLRTASEIEKQRLASLQTDIEGLQKEKEALQREVKEMQPLVENYRALESQTTRAEAESVIPQVQSVPPGPILVTPPPPPPPLRVPVVYLQVVSPNREHAQSMRKQLQQAGFIVPAGIEYVPRAAKLQNTEVRYYKKPDKDEAEKIAAVLRAAGETSVALLYLGLDNSTKVSARHYEVWFPAEAPKR